jgi:hypothetical protein
MCNFFSFVTCPDFQGRKYFYFGNEFRKVSLTSSSSGGEEDSHSTICKAFGLNENKCNKYEYNPIFGSFTKDQINSEIDDSIQAEEWVRKLDFKRVFEPLIIKEMLPPLNGGGKLTKEVEGLFYEWIKKKVGFKLIEHMIQSAVGLHFYNFLVDTSVKKNKRGNADFYSLVIREVRRSSINFNSISEYIINDSIWGFNNAYLSSFVDIKYPVDTSPAIKLWEMGFVVSFDGETWRLHQGKNAQIVKEKIL